MNGSITRREALCGAGSLIAGAMLEGCHPAHAPSRSGLAIRTSGEDSLRFHAAGKRLLFGTAVDVKALRTDMEYARLLREQCSILVAENCMKWAAVEWQQGHFAYDDGDTVIAFAEKNKIKMRGHTLVWHEALPPWVEKGLTPENARIWMVGHVQQMCTRYSGRIHSWDVVNEAISPRDGRPDGLRNSLWLRNVGDDYIEIAFRAARAADPAALLTYNDYALEDESQEHADRRRAVLNLVRRLRQRNVPIDAVGIQSHLYVKNGNGYGAGLRRFIADLRELNLQVFLTEVDVDDSHLPPSPDARDAAVAEGTGSFLDVALPDPAVRAVLTWCLTTQYTWLKQRYKNPGARGLPFDDALQPTAMFAAMRDAFDRRPPVIAARR